MRRGRENIVLLVILLMIAMHAGTTQAWQEKAPPPVHQDHEEMYQQHLTKVSSMWWVSGQMPMSEIATLKAQGFKMVINLRMGNEHNVAAEKAEVERVGMKYVHIPVVYPGMKDEQVAEFLKVTEDIGNRPAFIHCTMAIRAGGFWMVRRVLQDGWTVEKAEEEARRIGANDAYVRQARAYVANYSKK